MVDLDGAKEGSRINDEFVIAVAEKLDAKVQIGEVSGPGKISSTTLTVVSTG